MSPKCRKWCSEYDSPLPYTRIQVILNTKIFFDCFHKAGNGFVEFEIFAARACVCMCVCVCPWSILSQLNVCPHSHAPQYSKLSYAYAKDKHHRNNIICRKLCHHSVDTYQDDQLTSLLSQVWKENYPRHFKKLIYISGLSKLILMSLILNALCL